MEVRRHPVLAALVIAAAAIGFWHTCIIAPAWQHPFASGLGNVDFFTQIYPMSLRAAAWLRAGTFPLWNPFQLAGYPFLATALYGLCYPPNLIYLVLPTAVAIEALVVLHMALAGWFTYLYAGAVGIRPVGAAAGAAVYMFCGTMASQSAWFTPAVASSTWVPLAFLAVERLIQRRDGRAAVLLAAPVALALLGGWTQSWLYSMYAVALYAGVRVAAVAWHPQTRGHVPRIVGLLGLAIGLGIAVTALQVLPTHELQKLGPRRPGGLNLAQLVPMGPVAPATLVTQSLDWRTTPPFIDMFYLGPIVFALVGLSLCSRRRFSPRAAVWMLFVASCLVCVGTSTPFFEQVFLRLPAAGWFRLPQRIAFVLAFAAALLAAYGLDALADTTRVRRAVPLIVGLGVLGVSAAWLRTRPPLPESELVLVAVAMLVLTAAVVAPRGRFRAGLAVGVLLLVAADYVQGTTNVFRHPYHGVESLHRADPILQYVREHQGLDRTYLHDASGFDYSVAAKQGTLQGIYSITDYEPLSLLRFAEFFALMGRPQIGIPFAGRLSLDPASPQRSLIDVLSVRYIVTTNSVPLSRTLEDPHSGWQLVPMLAFGSYRLFELQTPLPRAYVATHAVLAADGQAGLAALTAADFDVRQTVVIEHDDGLPEAPPGGSPTPVTITPAHITDYEAREVVIETDATASGYLVLTDTYYPGWTAEVDGASVPIYPANHVVRAVPVPPGHHRIVFRYAPTSVLAGAAISALALVVLTTMALANLPGVPRAHAGAVASLPPIL